VARWTLPAGPVGVRLQKWVEVVEIFLLGKFIQLCILPLRSFLTKGDLLQNYFFANVA